MTRRSKVWIGTGLSVVLLVIVLAIISIQVLKSPWFAAYVREKIISITEESTGGKVEIGSFQFDWRHLRATVQNFVLHGAEPPGDPPLFVANRIELRLKLLAGLKQAVDLEYLGVDRPAVNVIVFPDGRTNIPAPKVVKKSNKNGLETVVDLAVHKFEVFNGSAAFTQQSIGFSGGGENLQVQMLYRAAPAGYQGDVKIGSLQLTPRGGQPLNASLDLPFEIGNDSIEVKNAVLASHDSQVKATVSISHIAQPVISTHLLAHVSLPEVQRTTGLDMDACKRNTPCYGEASVEAVLDQQGAQISSASLKIGQSALGASGTKSSVAFKGSLALDELGRLFRVPADPRGEIVVNGSAKNLGTQDYMVTGNIVGRGVAAGAAPSRIENVTLSSEIAADRNKIELHKLRVGAWGGEIDGDASVAEYSQIQFHGRLRSLRIRDFERQIASARQGYDGNVSGPLEASANLKLPSTTGIHAQAQLSIVPGTRGVPVSGKVQVAYDGAHNTVELGQSYLTLPLSRLDLSGVFGNRIVATFSSASLDDLYPALAMSLNAPPKAMPVALRGGKLALRAEVTGPLESPRIAAHIEADRFSVEQRPFDRFSADVSASASSAVIANGSLARQSLQAQLSGSIGLRKWSAENDSPIMLALNMSKGDIADVLALAGESDISGRGAVNLSARLSGTLGNPQGTAHLAAVNGALYDQPFDKADLNIDLADQLIRLNSLDVTAQMAHLQANGVYTHPRDSLLTGHAQAHLTGTGLQLSQIPAIANFDTRRPGISGTVQLAGDVTGDIRQVSGKMEFAPTNIGADVQARGLRDKKQNYGDLTAHAETAGSIVNFNLDSDLAGAAIKVTGRTTLATDYPTTADASVRNLRVENALALTGESFPAKGVVALTGRVSGTIKEPSADVQLSLTGANVYDEPIDSLQTNIRYSSQMVEISSLRLAAPAGSLTLNGSFSHPVNQFDSGRVEFHAESAGLRLAQIRNVQAKKPGIGGTLKLMADFAGEMKMAQGGRDISVSKVDANLKASEITYNGHSYGDAALTAENKGNAIAFKADSDFAGAVIHGEGDARLQPDDPVNAKFTVANLRYSNLRGWLDDSPVQPGFEALLEAQGTVSGPAKNPEEMKGNLQVTRLELSAAPRGTANQTAASQTASLALKNDGVIAVDYDRGSMRIRNAHLTGKSTDVSISGTAALTGASPLNLTVKADANLGVLQDIERDIHASGSVTVDAIVRGDPSQPLVNGTVQLKNASFNMESLPNGISKANGVIALNGSGASIRNLTAESGGGKLTLSGFAMLTGSTIRYSLNAKADHVQTRYEGISVVNSGVLTLGGTSDRSLISGNVTVERVVYNPQSDIGSMLSQLTHDAAPNVSGAGPASTMRLDIRIRTSPAVRFETTMAQALQVDADLTLLGTVQQPGIVGRINITQGDLIFFGNQYTVNRGLVAFYDPAKIDPRLNIDLETTVKSIMVTLGISGPMNNLKLSYRSDPPLQFDEIVGLLATGKRPSSDPNIVATQAAAPQQSAGEMGETALVSQAVASPLSSRLQRVFGVSQLRIDPTFAGGSALPQARLSLQQQVANTITFTYTQDLSQSNSELIRVEWALNPKFSAVATRDENGIFGVDFFYKRQFR